jgi:hypothetical protein
MSGDMYTGARVSLMDASILKGKKRKQANGFWMSSTYSNSSPALVVFSQVCMCMLPGSSHGTRSYWSAVQLIRTNVQVDDVVYQFDAAGRLSAPSKSPCFLLCWSIVLDFLAHMHSLAGCPDGAATRSAPSSSTVVELVSRVILCKTGICISKNRLAMT